MKFRTKLSILFILTGIVIAILLTFIPILNYKTKNMLKYESDHFVMYYEPEDKNVVDVVSVKLNEGHNKIAGVTDLSSKERTDIYMYKYIEVFHIKRYGILFDRIAKDWYISDHSDNVVVTTSPYSPGKNKDYQSVVNSIVHEYINTVMDYVNPKLSKFLNEGVAGYVSGDSRPVYPFTRIPTFSDTKISNENSFANTGLYEVSYTYMEYLDKEYGMGKIMELVKTGNYQNTFNKSEEDIYNEWIKFIESKYVNGKFRI